MYNMGNRLSRPLTFILFLVTFYAKLGSENVPNSEVMFKNMVLNDCITIVCRIFAPYIKNGMMICR